MGRVLLNQPMSVVQPATEPRSIIPTEIISHRSVCQSRFSENPKNPSICVHSLLGNEDIQL